MITNHPQRVVMLSLHTSPMTQAGTGDAGGMNVYVNHFSAALAARGVEVDLITTDAELATPDDSVTCLPDGRRLITLKLPDSARGSKSAMVEHLPQLGATALEVVRSCSSTPVDAVHSHYWISGQIGVDLARSLEAPLVHTMHTIGQVKQQMDPGSSEDPRRIPAERRIADCASGLTANTAREAEELSRVFSVPQQRIHEVQPGVDLSVFRPPQPPDPRRRTRPSSEVHMVFAGRLQPHKGPHILIEALGLLRRQRPELNVHLTIAGHQSGPVTVDCEALAAAEGVSDQVSRRPAMPHEQLAELFRSADAVLMPSYSESFGLVALEAMACGTPVLAHRVGGLSKLVENGASGELLGSLRPEEWAQAMARLAAERIGSNAPSQRWVNWSQHAARTAQGYSWDRTAQQALHAYAAAGISRNIGSARLSSTCH